MTCPACVFLYTLSKGPHGGNSYCFRVQRAEHMVQQLKLWSGASAQGPSTWPVRHLLLSEAMWREGILTVFWTYVLLERPWEYQHGVCWRIYAFTHVYTLKFACKLFHFRSRYCILHHVSPNTLEKFSFFSHPEYWTLSMIMRLHFCPLTICLQTYTPW